MEENNIQLQINQINKKIDILLEYVHQQNTRAEAFDDLISDLTIIGKDVYDSSVEMLDNHIVDINTEEIKLLFIKLLKNVNNFNVLIDTLESITDFVKDAAPIANEVIIDFTKKLHEYENKGYFEFMAGVGKIIDKVITNYSKEDLQLFSENIVLVMDLSRNITNPKMLNSVNKTITEFNKIERHKVKKISMWQLLREMRRPQMKQAMGFAVTLIKNLLDNKQ